MGRGRTWRRQIPWLRRYGRVFTFDAAPALTTVSAPLVELGEEAVDRLLFRIDNPTDSVRHIQLSCRMKAGQTTARARDKQKLS